MLLRIAVARMSEEKHCIGYGQGCIGVETNCEAEDWTSGDSQRHRIDSLSKGEGTLRIVKRCVGIVQNGGDMLGQRIE